MNRLRKEGRHSVSKIRRAVGMKIVIYEQMLKTVSQRRGINKMKSFRLHPI